jgi:hypothetical protein
MGNEREDADNGSQHGGIRVVDLGVVQAEESDPHVNDRPVRPDRRGILIGGALITCVFGGLTFLPSMNDGPPTENPPPAVKAVSACSALERAEQRDRALAPGEESPSHRDDLPSGYTVAGVMTGPNSSTLFGLVHPDGLFEVCKEAASDASFTVRFLPEAELGELPEGMTYAYDWSKGFTDNGVTLDLEGVRLTDGTVVQSLTLPDGRKVPAIQSH